MSMDEAKQYPNSKKIAAGTWTLRRVLPFWTIAGSAFPATWYIAHTYKTTNVFEDDTTLVERASLSLVDANPGSWYHDRAAELLYVSPSASSPDPYAVDLFAEIVLYVATHPKRFAGIAPHLGRIKRGPPIDLSVEEDFGKVGRIGGGSLDLLNPDGFFDEYEEMEIDGGLVTLLTGIDRA